MDFQQILRQAAWIRLSLMLQPALFLSGSPLQAQVVDRLFDPRVEKISFENVDFTPLEKRLRGIQQDLTENDTSHKVQKNFHDLYFNKLAYESFLKLPRPARVMDTIVEIFELNDQIGPLVVEGRKRALKERTPEEREEIVQEIARRTEQILSSFNRYFREPVGGREKIRLPLPENERHRFIHFIVQVQTFHARLSRALEGYFLEAEPTAVHWRDLEIDSDSVRVMAKSILKVKDGLGL